METELNIKYYYDYPYKVYFFEKISFCYDYMYTLGRIVKFMLYS